MNKSQKRRLEAALISLITASDLIEAVQCELQEAHDNKSERWQESDAGEAALETLTDLEEAFALAEEAVAALERLQ